MKFLTTDQQQTLDALQKIEAPNLEQYRELQQLSELRQSNVLKVRPALSLSVVSDDKTFDQQVEIFTSKSEDSQVLRKKLYTDYMKSHGCKTLGEAKWEILKKTFAQYVREQLMRSLHLARDSRADEAQEIVAELRKMQEIFKTDYDVSNFDGFVCEVDSRMTLSGAAAIFGAQTFLLNEAALDGFSSILRQSIQESHPKTVNDEFEYMQRLVSHPLMECLDSFKNEKDLISNIKEGRINLGFYHDLAVTILQLKEKNTSENYDALIMFLINEDLQHGLSNIARDITYEPKALRQLLSLVELQKPIHAQMIDNLIHQEIIPKCSKNYEETVTGLEERANSQFSANDSGYYFTAGGRRHFFHVHTASDKGQNQKYQQANTYNLFQKYGYDLGIDSTLSLSIVDHHVVSEHKNGYLAGLDISGFTDFDKYFLTTMVFETGFFTNIANLVTDQSELHQSRVLCQNASVVRDMRELSSSVILSQVDCSDYELIAAKSQHLIGILKTHEEFFKTLFKTTATAGQLRHELLHKNVLSTIKATLNIQEATGLAFFAAEDLTLIQELLRVSSPPFCREVSINEIAKDARRTLGYVLKTENIIAVQKSHVYTKIAEKSQLKKQQDLANAEVVEEKILLAAAKFDFSKTPSINHVEKMVDYFKEYPDKTQTMGRKIRASIDNMRAPYLGLLRKSIDAFEQSLKRGEMKSDFVFNQDSTKTLDKAVINLLKSTKGQAQNGLLCNLFCLYAKTHGLNFDLSSIIPKGAAYHAKF